MLLSVAIKFQQLVWSYAWSFTSVDYLNTVDQPLSLYFQWLYLLGLFRKMIHTHLWVLEKCYVQESINPLKLGIHQRLMKLLIWRYKKAAISFELMMLFMISIKWMLKST